MNDIETRLQQTFRRQLDPITAAGTLPRDVRVRARSGRAVAIAAMALGTAAVIAVAAVAVPSVLDQGTDPVGPGPSAFPIVPKENGRIAYSVAGDTGLELHSMRPDGSGDRVIPTPQGDPWLHSWSPDGSRLAVTIFPRGAGDRSIWVMDADGSDAVRVAAAENVSVPSWSPDGTSIAYAASRPGRTEIHVVQADGTDDRIVRSEEASGTFAIFSAQFSPDGTKILFDRGTDAFFDIYVMAATGSEPEQLTTAGTDYDPSWSPDGKEIAFTRQEVMDDRATSDIFVMDADGGNVRRLTDDGNTSLYPTWAPDGTKIAYNAGGSGGSGALVVIDADGSNRTELVPSGVLGVSWQPIVPSTTDGSEDVDDMLDEADDAPGEDDPQPSPPYEIPVDEFGCPQTLSSSRPVAGWVTDPVFIASGVDREKPWILCARIGTDPEGADDDVLCINFAYGDVGALGLDCQFATGQGDALRTGDLFAPVHSPALGFLVGAVPEDTGSVAFEPRRGPTMNSGVYRAPRKLGAPVRFFTLFVKPDAAGTFVARDVDGEAICSWHLEGPMEGPQCPELSRR